MHLEQRKDMTYKMNLYRITNDSYSAVINLSRGANCISLRNETYHAQILREPDFSAPPDNPYLYGMPVLFPVNRIAGGTFTFEGREYTFPVNEASTGCHLHGMLHQQEFKIEAAGEDYVESAYRASGESPYLAFPHAFEMRICYYLKEDGLEQVTEVKNLSDRDMPVMIGFHTTFALPFISGQSAEDLCIFADITDEIERDKKDYLPTGRLLSPDEITGKLQDGTFSPFEQKISRHYKAGAGGKMYIRDKKRNLSVLYENSPNMKFRLLFNGNADSYICLEPQNCLVDCLNQKSFPKEYSGFEYAKPGETKTYRSRISLISG